MDVWLAIVISSIANRLSAAHIGVSVWVFFKVSICLIGEVIALRPVLPSGAILSCNIASLELNWLDWFVNAITTLRF